MANTLIMWAIRAGIPLPPYGRRGVLIVETVGRRSGKRYRTPVGCIEDDGKLVVVSERGARADWVRNALKQDGRLRIRYDGRWRDARLRLLEKDPEVYLQRMSKLHAAAVRRQAAGRWRSATLQAVEITPE